MLISMTGYGEARQEEGPLTITVELRTTNNRYFKLTVRSNENHGPLESLLDRVIRKRIKRGSILANVQVERQLTADDYQLNFDVLERYHRQLGELTGRWHLADPVPLSALLTLPGVVDQAGNRVADLEKDWPLIEATTHAALDQLQSMRQDEGAALETDLRENCQTIARRLTTIETRLPEVAEEYRARLVERVNRTLENHDITVAPNDVIREVSMFAERSDFSEEIVRLRSHLDQFQEVLAESQGAGRKLEFITQEMFREANTIGSKANDTQIPPAVVEMKAAIERIREQVQNVE